MPCIRRPETETTGQARWGGRSERKPLRTTINNEHVLAILPHGACASLGGGCCRRRAGVADLVPVVVPATAAAGMQL